VIAQPHVARLLEKWADGIEKDAEGGAKENIDSGSYSPSIADIEDLIRKKEGL